MRGAALAAILLCAAACAGETGVSSEASANAVADAPAAGAIADEEDADEEADGEHKQASFLIVIEHPDGWRCSGSLVSLRTALTSAWCARGRGRAAADELWALAAAAAASPGLPAARQHGARRIVRIAVAADADAEVSDVSQREEVSWRGGAMDLAVVELEEPFGSAALTVPILMATRAEECAAPAECHVARAVTRPPSRRAHLRIASAALRRPDACAAAAPHWTAVQERALCLVGSELCESDWGAGVVCGGKVCGVLSRSVRAAAEGAAPAPAGGADGAGDRSCGTTHVAQSTARWRRFLHCAHTLRACGSDGDCAELCVERRLIEETSPPTEAAPAPARISPTRAAPTRAMPPPPPASHTRRPRPLVVTTKPTRSPTMAPWSSATRSVTPARARARPRFRPPPRPPPQTPPPPPPPPPADAGPAPARGAFEFEPNRADFKAGEYGDNAADYGGGDELVPPTRTPLVPIEPRPSPLPALPPQPAQSPLPGEVPPPSPLPALPPQPAQSPLPGEVPPPSPLPALPPQPAQSPLPGEVPPPSPLPALPPQPAQSPLPGEVPPPSSPSLGPLPREQPEPPGPLPLETQSPPAGADGAPPPLRSIPPAERRSAGALPTPPSPLHSAAPATTLALALLVLALFVNTVSCTR